MKHTKELTVQDSIALVIMAGRQCLENSLSDYIEASSYHVEIYLLSYDLYWLSYCILSCRICNC